jgi:hypothetical protein
MAGEAGRLPQVLGCKRQWGYFRACSLTGGGRVAWVLRLVKIDAEGEGQATDVMEIERPGDLADIADLGWTLAESKRPGSVHPIRTRERVRHAADTRAFTPGFRVRR